MTVYGRLVDYVNAARRNHIQGLKMFIANSDETELVEHQGNTENSMNF